MISMTRDVTHNLGMYDLATSFNWRPVSQAATVIASYWTPSWNIMVLLRINAQVKDHYGSNHLTSLSVPDDNFTGIQPARKPTYALY